VEPENAQPAVTNLPHINPTFANQVSVDHIDPSTSNGSASMSVSLECFFFFFWCTLNSTQSVTTVH
jgi:hypothetical protein